MWLHPLSNGRTYRKRSLLGTLIETGGTKHMVVFEIFVPFHFFLSSLRSTGTKTTLGDAAVPSPSLLTLLTHYYEQSIQYDEGQS